MAKRTIAQRDAAFAKVAQQMVRQRMHPAKPPKARGLGRVLQGTFGPSLEAMAMLPISTALLAKNVGLDVLHAPTDIAHGRAPGGRTGHMGLEMGKSIGLDVIHPTHRFGNLVFDVASLAEPGLRLGRMGRVGAAAYADTRAGLAPVRALDENPAVRRATQAYPIPEKPVPYGGRGKKLAGVEKAQKQAEAAARKGGKKGPGRIKRPTSDEERQLHATWQEADKKLKVALRERQQYMGDTHPRLFQINRDFPQDTHLQENVNARLALQTHIEGRIASRQLAADEALKALRAEQARLSKVGEQKSLFPKEYPSELPKAHLVKGEEVFRGKPPPREEVPSPTGELTHAHFQKASEVVLKDGSVHPPPEFIDPRTFEKPKVGEQIHTQIRLGDGKLVSLDQIQEIRGKAINLQRDTRPFRGGDLVAEQTGLGALRHVPERGVTQLYPIWERRPQTPMLKRGPEEFRKEVRHPQLVAKEGQKPLDWREFKKSKAQREDEAAAIAEQAAPVAVAKGEATPGLPRSPMDMEPRWKTANIHLRGGKEFRGIVAEQDYAGHRLAVMRGGDAYHLVLVDGTGEVTRVFPTRFKSLKAAMGSGPEYAKRTTLAKQTLHEHLSGIHRDQLSANVKAKTDKYVQEGDAHGYEKTPTPEHVTLQRPLTEKEKTAALQEMAKAAEEQAKKRSEVKAKAEKEAAYEAPKGQVHRGRLPIQSVLKKIKGKAKEASPGDIKAAKENRLPPVIMERYGGVAYVVKNEDVAHIYEAAGSDTVPVEIRDISGKVPKDEAGKRHPPYDRGGVRMTQQDLAEAIKNREMRDVGPGVSRTPGAREDIQREQAAKRAQQQKELKGRVESNLDARLIDHFETRNAAGAIRKAVTVDDVMRGLSKTKEQAQALIQKFVDKKVLGKPSKEHPDRFPIKKRGDKADKAMGVKREAMAPSAEEKAAETYARAKEAGQEVPREALPGRYAGRFKENVQEEINATQKQLTEARLADDSKTAEGKARIAGLEKQLDDLHIELKKAPKLPEEFVQVREGGAAQAAKKAAEKKAESQAKAAEAQKTAEQTYKDRKKLVGAIVKRDGSVSPKGLAKELGIGQETARKLLARMDEERAARGWKPLKRTPRGRPKKAEEAPAVAPAEAAPKVEQTKPPVAGGSVRDPAVVRSELEGLQKQMDAAWETPEGPTDAAIAKMNSRYSKLADELHQAEQAAKPPEVKAPAPSEPKLESAQVKPEASQRKTPEERRAARASKRAAEGKPPVSEEVSKAQSERAKQGVAQRKKTMAPGEIGMTPSQLHKVGVADEAQRGLRQKMGNLIRENDKKNPGKPPKDAELKKVFTDQFGKEKGTDLFRAWFGESGKPALMKRYPAKGGAPIEGSVGDALKAAVVAMFSSNPREVYYFGHHELKVQGEKLSYPIEVPLSNSVIGKRVQVWRYGLYSLNEPKGFNKFMSSVLRNTERDEQLKMEKVARDMQDFSEGLSRTGVYAHSAKEVAEIQARYEKSVEDWYQRARQNRGGGRDVARWRKHAVDWIDTSNQLAGIGTLFLKPGYVPPNLLGQLFISLADHHLNPYNMWHSYRMYHRLMKTEEGRAFDMQVRHDMGTGMNRAITVGASGLKFEGKGIRKQVKFTAQRRYARGVHLPERVPKVGGKNLPAAAHASMAALYERILDTPWRMMSFYNEARRFGFDTEDKLLTLRKPENSGVYRQITIRANRNIIEFGRMGKAQQDYITRVIWFYPWLRGASKFSARFLLEHPFQSATLLHLHQQAADYLDKMLGLSRPSYAQNLFPTGGFTDVPGLGKVPNVINLTSADVLGTPVQPIQTAISLYTGKHLQAGSLPSYLTPAGAAVFAVGLRQDPLTGSSLAGKSAPGIIAKQLTSPVSFLRARDYETRAKKIAKGEVDPSKILLPYMPGQGYKRWATGLTPFPYNPREGESRGFAEGLQGASKNKVVSARANRDFKQFQDAAKSVGVTLPPQVAKSVRLSVLRKQNMISFGDKYGDGSNLSPIKRLGSDVNLAIRLGYMSPEQGKQLLIRANPLSKESISSIDSSLSGIFLGGVYSAYKRYVNEKLHAAGKQELP